MPQTLHHRSLFSHGEGKKYLRHMSSQGGWEHGITHRAGLGMVVLKVGTATCLSLSCIGLSTYLHLHSFYHTNTLLRAVDVGR